jgi:hypothetical protein
MPTDDIFDDQAPQKIEKKFSKTQSQVDHPPHYNSGKIEVIDAIEDWELNFSRGNAVKYIARAGRKSSETEIQDLEKALWYIQRELQRIKK